MAETNKKKTFSGLRREAKAFNRHISHCSAPSRRYGFFVVYLIIKLPHTSPTEFIARGEGIRLEGSGQVCLLERLFCQQDFHSVQINGGTRLPDSFIFIILFSV